MVRLTYLVDLVHGSFRQSYSLVESQHSLLRLESTLGADVPVGAVTRPPGPEDGTLTAHDAGDGREVLGDG